MATTGTQIVISTEVPEIIVKADRNTIPYKIPSVIRYSISQEDAADYAASLAYLTGISIEAVKPTVQQLGRVLVFEAKPWMANDPPILFVQTDTEALYPYYDLWRKGIKTDVMFPKQATENVIRYFRKNSTSLSVKEKDFATLAILRFMNQVLMR